VILKRAGNRKNPNVILFFSICPAVFSPLKCSLVKIFGRLLYATSPLTDAFYITSGFVYTFWLRTIRSSSLDFISVAHKN